MANGRASVNPPPTPRWVLMKPFLSRTLTDTLRAALGLSQEPDSIRHSTSQTV